MQEVKETWSDRMREKFLREGKRETLLRLLTVKFGPLSPETITRVEAMASTSELDAHLERIISAESLEDMGL